MFDGRIINCRTASADGVHSVVGGRRTNDGLPATLRVSAGITIDYLAALGICILVQHQVSTHSQCKVLECAASIITAPPSEESELLALPLTGINDLEVHEYM